MRVLRYGRAAALLEFDDTAEVMAAYRALRSALDRADGRLAAVTEVVPAARTVLVAVAPGGAVPVAGLRELLAAPRTPHTAALTTAESGNPEDTPPTVLSVRYDGADLELVARTAGLEVAEVVRLHSGAEYTVAFCGFAPGFGYLVGLPEPLRQPRLDESRPSVPSGSVGVAGEYTGIYPRVSPGGWRLLGRTDEVLFDPAADPPARLIPGTRVRFEPVS